QTFCPRWGSNFGDVSSSGLHSTSQWEPAHPGKSDPPILKYIGVNIAEAQLERALILLRHSAALSVLPHLSYNFTMDSPASVTALFDTAVIFAARAVNPAYEDNKSG